MLEDTLEIQVENKKELYAYQKGDIDAIFERIDNAPSNHHLLYQLPTGGGKTVVFSEIVRRYLSQHDKKVVVLTHRIELCKQTSKMLKGFDVKNKIIKIYTYLLIARRRLRIFNNISQRILQAANFRNSVVSAFNQA